MARKSKKINEDKCRDCAFEIYDVMKKHGLSVGQEVRVLAGVLYSNLAVWHQNLPKEVFEKALWLFIGLMYPEAESEESKELETLLKKHFV